MQQREFNQEIFSIIGMVLHERMSSMNYIGDISDCGNEIGYVIAKVYENMTEQEITDFIHGIRHGISLTNGTH